MAKKKKPVKLSPVKQRAKARARKRDPNPYRSGFEQNFIRNMEARGWGLAYEPIRLPFIEPAKARHYVPDFVFDPKTKKQVPNITCIADLLGKIILENKGLLDAATRKKMKLVKEAYPDLDIRFVFMADNWVTKTKKQRYSQWAEANGFKWWVGTCPPEEWFK
jgi:Phage endonuclease I